PLHNAQHTKPPFFRSPQPPKAMLARTLLRFVSAHLARRDAARLAQKLDPINGGTDPNSELLRRSIAGHAAALNRSNHPFAKVHRVRLAHPCWPPSQPARWIRNRLNLGSQIDSGLTHPAYAAVTSRWVSMPATAGSARRTAVFGRATGSAAHRPGSSTSWSMTTARRSISFVGQTPKALSLRVGTPTR